MEKNKTKMYDGKKNAGMRMNYLKRNGNEITDTKESFTFKQVFVPKSTEPNFIKLYLQDAIELANLSVFNSVREKKVDVLYMMLHWLDYTNEITLNYSRRETICERCGITQSYLKQVIRKFIDTQVLFQKFDSRKKLIKGVYIANPHFFGRGTWENVFNLRMTIIYDEQQKRYIQTEVNPDPQMQIPLDM